MTQHHFDDIEIDTDLTHPDSPWVDLTLSSGDGEDYAPTAHVSLTPTEARNLGLSIIASADAAEAAAA